MRTITADNVKAFRLNEEIADELLGVKFYFVAPYSSLQRGTNENTNGLIRQCILKGSDLDHSSDQYTEHITIKLNHGPRKKTLIWKPESGIIARS